MKKIAIALMLSFACTVAWMVLSGLYYHNNINAIAYEIYGVYPVTLGLCAIVTSLFYDSNLKSLAFTFPKTKYVGIAIGAAFVFTWLPFSFNLIADRVLINSQPKLNIELVEAGLPVALLLAMSEEIMWRGFLLTNFLKKYGFRNSSLFIGIACACWKLPLFIQMMHGAGTAGRLWFSIPMFVAGIVSLSFISNYLRILSKSIWPSILLHGFLNYFSFVYMDQIEVPVSDSSFFFMHANGLFYTLFLVAGAIVFTHLFYRSSVRKRVVSKRARLASMLAAEIDHTEKDSVAAGQLVTDVAGT